MNKSAARRSQQGHLMVGLVFFMAVLLILSAVAVQEFSQILRRDNEAEMIFRAQEIVRALARYQKDRGAYPIELKMLDEPGNKDQRYIRRMYEDPLTRDGEWGLLYAGPGGGIIDPSRPTEDPVGIMGERRPGPTG
jgi:type II secretory pathway pseudopilin PulG